jgi:precorrin-6B methylase 2
MQLYTNILRGGTSDLELQWLFNTAKNMNSIVEIGSFLGRSTLALLSGINPNGKVYAIDPFDVNVYKSQQDPEYSEIYEKFVENTKDFKNLEIIRDKSCNAAIQLKNERFDMIFIDGDHTYEAVKKDIELWLPKTKRIICGHDYNTHYSSVVLAVKDTLGPVDVYENIWIKNI